MMHEPMMTEPEWLQAVVKAEEEYGGDIQIGGKPPVKQQIDPLKLQQGRNQIRLYSLLYGELKQLLDEVDFGSGGEAAYTQGRQCIYERMQAISLEQKTSLEALLTAAATLAPAQLQAQTRQQLYQLLTESDWQSITAAALTTVELKLLQQVAVV